MKTLKKCFAFMLAVGLVVSAVKVTVVTVLAEDNAGSSTTTEGDGNNETQQPAGGSSTTSSTTYEGPDKPVNSTGQYKWWHDTSSGKWYWWNNDEWTLSESMSGSSSSSESTADPVAQAAAEAVQREASDEGFHDVGDMYRAAEKGMSAGEFYNNVVISTPGLPNAVTVGQGGGLIVNGQVTNMGASISKVTNRSYIDSVRINQPEGRLLNVVDVSYPATEATINFYMPSVTGEMDITVLQYSAGAWVNVDVAEVREDHVVVDLKGDGIIAFIAK